MCTASYLQDIAVSMGMCPEKGLPMANEENKKILALIDDLAGQKNQLQTTLQHFNERADRLVSHARNSEITHNQNMRLIFAFQSDLRTEQNLRKLAERENSKLKHDLKGIDQELETLNQHEDTTENDIKKRNKTISDLSGRISWIKTALAEWRQCMAEGHEANLLIEKYCKEDQKKYIEIDNKRQILQNAINKERQKLIDLVEEQKSLEQNLDRTANLYRNAHTERRDMVNTWKSSVNHMNRRESDILQLEAEYEKVLKTCQVKEAELKNEEKTLDDIITDNREVEGNIEELNEEISRLRERLQHVIDTVALRENEVDILKKELAGLAHRVEMQRRNNRRDVQRQSDKELELARCIEGNKKLDENHKMLSNKNMNAQERLRVIEEMIDSEERTKGKLTLETNRMNDLLFRTQEHLRRFKEDAKLAEVENGGIRLNMATIGTQMKDANKLLITKTEEFYDLSLKVVIVERRIGKVKGNLVDPFEERQRIVLLTKLEAYYEDLTKTLTGLQGQTMKLEADMRNLTLCYNNDMKEVESMNFKIKEVQLYCEGGVKKHRQTIRDNQEKIVELSILKMRHNEMEHQKAQCQDRTYNLDKHRLEMNKSIKQRTVNIRAQFDLLYLKRKHLLEELSTLRCDIGDRSIRIEAAKARYELAASLLGKNDDGSLVTCTQMKIENAQEKQMLLDEGNQLNADVLRAEQEIKAMEHTLVLMNSSNEMYRRNFEELDEDAEDLQQLKTLQAEYCTLLTQLKTLRNRIIQQERQVEILLQEKETLEDNVQEVLRKRLDNKEMLTKVHKEIQDQEVKIQRADREAKVAWKSTRQRSFSTAFLANFNKELELQELEKRNNTVLQLFADLIDTDMDLAPQASKMLYAKGLECPKARKYRSYSSSWRGEFQDLSSSSKEMLSSRSSGSVTKMSASTRASIVSIDFPCQSFSGKRK